MSSFTVKLGKSVKMIKFKCKHNLQVFIFGLRSLSHFQILTKIAYSDLSRNLENWLILKFLCILCKIVKVNQDDQIRMIYKCFLDEWKRIKKFQSLSNFDRIAYPDLTRKLENWLSLSSFTVKLWKSVKMIKFDCKLDLQMFSWWMEQN